MSTHSTRTAKYKAWASSRQIDFEAVLASLEQHRAAGRRVVTTNGCFDILHGGHLRLLREARALGDVLVVGLNSDGSVAMIKGAGRPVMPESDRAAILSALEPVDYVVVFGERLPCDLMELLRPDLHCKAEDYSPEGLPEAEVIRRHGGQVQILPLTEGDSSSRLIKRICASVNQPVASTVAGDSVCDLEAVTVQLLEGANVLRQTAYQLSGMVVDAAGKINAALSTGGKVLICGNGGSAADAQHFAAELVGRYRREREAWPAIALTTDSSILTALGNDYSFDQIFARQVAALGSKGDVLVAISTSGSSPNVLEAASKARARGLYVIGLTGCRESPLGDLADICLRAPAAETSLIQQAHIALIHSLCELVERRQMARAERCESVA
jgi:D-sedoheptulose 7-phosphate isomerase